MPLNLNHYLLLALLLISTQAVNEFYHGGMNCSHDHIDKPEPQLLDVDEKIEIGERNLGSGAYNFRMQAYYNTLDSAPSGFKTYFETRLGPAVLDFFQGALQVKYPVQGLLTIPSYQTSLCGIPTPSILRNGIEADYFIMFDSTFDSSGSWVAESYACFLATGTKRPLIAKSLINRNFLQDPGSNVLLHEKNTYLVLHEMTHTLGFSTSLYPYFLDSYGNTLTGQISTTQTSLGSAEVVNVEPLTTRLRNFFGCSSLRGGQMENTGSSSTAGSHFERRYFPFEIMSSGLIYQESYSQFTLALLEGSGWYVPNYDFADGYWFGQGQGCNFFYDSCSVANSVFSEYCSGSTSGCSVPGRGGGYCHSDIRSDGCRFIVPDVNLDCDNPAGTNYVRLPEIQSFGRESYSKCFTGTLSSYSSGSSSGSFCFKYNCVGSGQGTTLELILGSNTVTCTHAGSISVSGYGGEIDCPDPVAFCSTVGAPTCPRGCMGRGSCVNGKCECYSGFSGKDCGL